MCLIILKRAGVEFKEEWFHSGWRSNSDGCGFMYAVNGEIHTFKSMDKEEAFKELVNVVLNYGDLSDIVIHFRWATHGLKTLINVHPFEVNKELYFCHNGVFSGIDCSSNKDISDTQHFNQQCLQKLPNNFLYSEGILELLSNYSSSSKLVFLESDGTSTIINADLGEEHAGNWFSNKYFMNTVERSKNTYKSFGRWDYEKKKWVYDEEEKKSKSTVTYYHNYYGSEYSGDDDYLSWWERERFNKEIDTKKQKETKDRIISETQASIKLLEDKSKEGTINSDSTKDLKETIDTEDFDDVPSDNIVHFPSEHEGIESIDYFEYLNSQK